MFVGGSAGSTGGSIKVVRHLLLGKVAAARAPPDPASGGGDPDPPQRLVGATSGRLRAVTSFILLYVGLFVVGAGVIAIDTAVQGPSLSLSTRSPRRPR